MDSSSKITKSHTFPLVDLTSVAGPSDVSDSKSTKKRARPPIDVEEAEVDEDAQLITALRRSPRKRAKTDTIPAVAKGKSKEKPSSKIKGKGRAKQIVDATAAADGDDDVEAELAEASGGCKSATSSKRSKRKPDHDILNDGGDDDGSETAVENDVKGQPGGRGKKKSGAIRSREKTTSKAKTRKKAGSGSKSITPSRRRSQYPAPNLETVYEEVSEDEDESQSPPQQAPTQLSGIVIIDITSGCVSDNYVYSQRLQ